MKCNLLVCLLLCFSYVFISCDNSEKKEAEQIVSIADSLYRANDYDGALEMLQTLKEKYPNALQARQQGLELKREIKIAISHKDSIDIVHQMLLIESYSDSLYSEFVLVEAKDMPDENILRYHGYDAIKKHPNSPFLDVYITSKGDLELVAGISGNKYSGISYIKVEDIQDKTFYISDTLNYDGGLNYRYNNLGIYYERLTFSGESANKIASFIENAPNNDKIMVSFGLEKGLWTNKFLLPYESKIAIVTCYHYAQSLASLKELQSKLDIHNKRIAMEEERKMKDKVKDLK